MSRAISGEFLGYAKRLFDLLWLRTLASLITVYINLDGNILFLIFLPLLFAFRYRRRLRRSKKAVIENPYLLPINCNGRRYIIAVASVRFEEYEHYTLRRMEALTANSDGTTTRYDQTEELRTRIASLLEELDSYTYLHIYRVKRGNSFASFKILLYSVKHEFSENSFTTIHTLAQQPHISLLNLSKLSRRKISRNFYLNRNRVFLNPVQLARTSEYQFELGWFELDIIKELISTYNAPYRSIQKLEGSHHLGRDIFQQPVYIEKPQSCIYIGSKLVRMLPRFEFYNNATIITSDPLLVDGIMDKYDPEALRIDDLSVDILSLGKQFPQFLRKLLLLLEETIPSSIKTGGQQKISSLLLEFLESKFLVDPDSFLKPVELFDSHTYKEYSMDLSTDIFAKFQDILSLPLLNNTSTPLLEFLARDGKKLISLEGMSDKAQIAISIILLAIKDQYLSPNPILFLTSVLEPHLQKITRILELNDVLIHTPQIGSNLKYLSSFDLLLCDADIEHDRLKKSVFSGLREVRNGMLLNHNFRDYSILEGSL